MMSSQAGPSLTPMPSDFPVPRRGHIVALAVTLSLVGVLLVIGTTFFAMHMRRMRLKQQRRDEKNLSFCTRKSMLLDLRHPASHITPFIVRQPGTNMRIARRRLDGAWDFEDPQAPFYPQGVADPSPLPRSLLSSKHWTVTTEVTETKAEWDCRRDTDSNSVQGLEPPPPAYHPENLSDEGYTIGHG